MRPPIPPLSAGPEDDIAALVHAAIIDEACSISRMLQEISERLAAFGCAVWELAPGGNLAAQPPQGHLFTVATWFQTKDFFAVDAMPLATSATGPVVLQGEAAIFPDIRQTGVWGSNHPFVAKHELASMCSVPVVFLDGRPGAVNIYRHAAEAGFEAPDLERLKRMAALIPALFRANREQVGLRLLSSIDAHLREVALAGGNQPVAKAEKQRLLTRICETIRDAFNCLEVAVFLEDRLQRGGFYERQAQVSPWPPDKAGYRTDEFDRLTSWVLRERRDLNLLDLAHLTRDREYLLQQYGPDLPLAGEERHIREALTAGRYPGSEALPPLSFVAVPVFGGDRFLGVLRCAQAQGPFYFPERDVALLKVAAAQLGYCWATWLDNREVAQEKEAWLKLVTGLGKLNEFVSQELARPEGSPQPELLLAEVLNQTRGVFPGAEKNTVRLLDAAKDDLYFAAFSDAVWQVHDSKEESAIRKGVQRRFPVTGLPKSAAAYVFQTRKTYVLSDPAHDPFYTRIFPGVHRMVIAPILLADRIFGVLDIRWTEDVPMPRYAVDAANLLGGQMALYLVMTEAVVRLRSSEQAQQRILEDLAHQLKGPLGQALLRAKLLVDAAVGDQERLPFAAVHGLIRKASRVAWSMKALADLTHNRPLSLSVKPLNSDQLIKLLIETAADTEIAIEAERKIRLTVVRTDFQGKNLTAFRADITLLEQMIYNLCDNAGKYSYSATTIYLKGGISQAGSFYISVSNRGIPVREGDVHNCFVRGWRSPEATWATGEGSGLGLWLVEQIMLAHGGRVELIRRNADGDTEFRIYFN